MTTLIMITFVVKGFNEKIVNAYSLDPGMYIFKMQLTDKVVKGKMIKKAN